MAIVLTSLPGNTTPLIIGDIGGIVLPTHPSSLNLDTDFALSESEVRESGEIQVAILALRCTLDIDGEIIDDTNAATALGDSVGLQQVEVDSSLSGDGNIGNPLSVNLDTVTGGGDNLIQSTANGLYATAPNASTVTLATAYANTDATGALNFGQNLTVVRTAVGTYQYTFSTPLASDQYVVVGNSDEVTPGGLFTDYNLWTRSRDVNGFTLSIGAGDNGGTQDVLSDIPHSLVVYGASTVVNSISSTDDIPEGVTNEYYTDTKVDARMPIQILVTGTASSFNQNVSEGSRYLYLADPSNTTITFTPGAGETYNLFDPRLSDYAPAATISLVQGTFIEVVRTGLVYNCRLLQTAPNRFVAFAERSDLVSVTIPSQDYLTLAVDIPETAQYEIGYHVTMRHSSASSNYQFRCINTTTGDIVGYGDTGTGTGFYELEPKDGGTDIRIPHTVLATLNLPQGANNLTIQFGRADGSNTTSMYYATIFVREIN